MILWFVVVLDNYLKHLLTDITADILNSLMPLQKNDFFCDVTGNNIYEKDNIL